MRRQGIYAILFIGLITRVSAQPQPKVYFPTLVQSMNLKTPELNGGDYEIRVWQKCQLCFGEAHVLHQLMKNDGKVSLYKYVMHFKKHQFIDAAKTSLRGAAINQLWQRLVQQGILTLPAEAVIANELHPKPQKDSTWNTVDTDGKVSVHSKRIKPSIWISDGESYHFEIFSTDGYRAYTYGNPYGYVKHKPNFTELQKVVSILNEFKSAF